MALLWERRLVTSALSALNSPAEPWIVGHFFYPCKVTLGLVYSLFVQTDVYFPTSNLSMKSFQHVVWTLSDRVLCFQLDSSLTLRVFPSCGSVHHILTGHFDGDTPLCNQSCSQLRGVKYKLNWWILAALLACHLSCASVTHCPTRTYQHIQGFDKDMLSYICWKPPTETLYPQTKADYRWFAGTLADCRML